MEREHDGETWDVEADVVVGFGAAGVAAAVTAHDLGAEVVILEKAPEGEHGGNTRVAGQGYLNTSSAEEAAAYLTALCGPYTVPEPMVRVWAEECAATTTGSKASAAIRVKARRGVALTCGGFENNQEMIRNYLPGVPIATPRAHPGTKATASGWRWRPAPTSGT